MARYDVFNGDADGICALLQLRLAAPADSTLITGVKRDIDLKEVPRYRGTRSRCWMFPWTRTGGVRRCAAAGAKVTTSIIISQERFPSTGI